MHILRQGYPFIGTMLVIAVILYLLFGVFGIVLPLLLAAYFAYFFRSPDRKVKKDPDIFYSPADGTVMGV
ncbi:MAG TPA: phosphatidylserine decarboxylase family protein, partial [Acidaminococcaceae bacterium]|nr:phosphatidylserine decarboxylase family protein [Acidaminococcaceae bacterium]